MSVRPTAQSLVLDVTSTQGGRPIAAATLIRVGELFGVTSNNIRVALARLTARGLLERNERGQYSLARGARAVGQHVSSWTAIADRMVPWDGRWLGIHTASLSRRPRTAVKRRQRALDFLGFCELEPGLWLRPSNLAGGIALVREQLGALGMEVEAPVFVLSELDTASEARARTLWDVPSLEAKYRSMQQEFDESAARLPSLPPAQAMIEPFRLGGEAIRLLAFDPLLPEPIAAAAPRDAFVAALRRYDRLGWSYWHRFIGDLAAPISGSLVDQRPIDPARGATP